MGSDPRSPSLIDAHNPGAMTGAGNNTYLFAGGSSAALIDAGVGHERHLAAIDEQLAAGDRRLDYVLVTHGHADHASGAEAIAARHPGVVFAKYPWPEEDSRYHVAWHPLADGQAIDIGGETLVVVSTPGHSPDHVVFWHGASRTAFTGDLVTLGSSVMIHASRGGNLGAYLASLVRVLQLNPLVLLPAHGSRIDDPAAVITAYIEHRRMRERQVLSALRDGRASVQAIAESIYDGLDPALLPAARENVRAHLEKLKSEGLVADHDGRWVL